jgi:hypothetical protein
VQENNSKLTFPGYGVPYKERMAHYARQEAARKAEQPLQVPEAMAAMTASERRAMYDAKQKADEAIRLAVEERTRSKNPPDPLKRHQSELQERLRLAAPSEKESIRQRLRILGSEIARRDEQAERQAQIEKLAADKSVQLAREHAEALKRSFKATHPACNEADINFAIALAESNEWDSPERLSADYWQAVSRLDDLQAQADRQKFVESSAAVSKAFGDQNLLAERMNESAKRANESAQRAGGDNEGKP